MRGSNFVPVLFVLLALALVYSLTHIVSLSRQNVELATQNQATQLQLDHLENELSFEQSELQSALMPLASSLATPEAPPAVVAKQSTPASPVPSPQGEEAGVIDLAATDQLMREDLKSQLQELREQKQNMIAQSRESQFNQSSSQKLEFDQLTAQIAQETQKIDALKQQLVLAQQAYGMNQFDLDAATRAHDLSLAIDQENAVLQGMRDSRDANNAQWAYKIGADRFQAEQEVQDLNAQEQELTSQLASPTPSK